MSANQLLSQWQVDKSKKKYIHIYIYNFNLGPSLVLPTLWNMISKPTAKGL